MNRIFLFISIVILPFTVSNAQTTNKNLQAKLEQTIANFKGNVGIHVHHLQSGETVDINADSIFPTASIVKIPILLGVFDKIEKQELHYHQPLVYRDSIKYGGSGLMQFYQDSTQTDLSTLISLMLSYSDNTTSLWNQALAGGGLEINELMDKLGYHQTRVNSRTLGREEIWEKFGWGQSTPKEMADILIKLYQKKIISPAASEQMFRLLSNTFYTDYAISRIPPGINVASKQGMVNSSRSEVFLVNSPSGDYVCAIFTANNEDLSWEFDNEAWELIRAVSGATWNYFNPDHIYNPPVDQEKYLEGLDY